MLYCTLTRSEVNARYADLHLSGRRFQTKLYQKWKAAMLKRKKELLFQEKLEKRLKGRGGGKRKEPRL